MDIITTIGTSISLANRLREISKNIENAEFKNLLADLSLELADLKLNLAGVLDENAELKSRVRELEASDADPCPKCRKRTWELNSSKPHRTLGELGAMVRTYKCADCGFSEETVVTP